MKSLEKQARAALEYAGLADAFNKTKTGSFVTRRSFFYRHGGDKEAFAAKVGQALALAGIEYEIIYTWEKLVPFRGGQSIAAGSHWGCEFKLKGEPK